MQLEFFHWRRNAMSSKIEMYVPTVDGDGQALPLEIAYRWRDHVAHTFTELFGGCTCVQASGYYRNTKGNVIMEDVNVVYSYTEKEQADLSHRRVIELAKRLCAGLRQECVLVVYDGKAEFVNKE